MNKRLLWIMFFAAPLAIITTAVIWQLFHARHLKGASHIYTYDNGLVTDLTKPEVVDAIAVLQKERQMWSEFKSISGHITVKYTEPGHKTISLSGDVSLNELSRDPDNTSNLVWPFSMDISNDLEGWSITTDGTRTNTHINCEDSNKVMVINAIGPTAILEMLCMPKVMIVPLFKDGIFPQGRETMNQIVGAWNPWRNPDATGIPHSYTFKDLKSRMDSISFVDGHFSRWQRVRDINERGNGSVHCSKPAMSNHFWFPTTIDFEGQGEKLSITLTGVVVGVNDANQHMQPRL